MIRHVGFSFFFDGAEGIEEGKGGVGFGRGGQINAGLCQRKAAFGHADALEGLPAACDHAHRLRVGQPHVFPSKDSHAAEDETGIFTCIHHFGHPVESSIGVGATQAFDEGRDGVVMHISFFIVEDSAALDRFFGNFEGDVETAVFPSFRRFHSQFQGIQHASGIPVGHIYQMV